jgi:mannose-6-phosphate isomerase-like protein (cupin superfamily)
MVKGPVKVQIGNKTRMLQTGEQVTMPAKTIHRLVGAGPDAIIIKSAGHGMLAYFAMQSGQQPYYHDRIECPCPTNRE